MWTRVKRHAVKKEGPNFDNAQRSYLRKGRYLLSHKSKEKTGHSETSEDRANPSMRVVSRALLMHTVVPPESGLRGEEDISTGEIKTTNPILGRKKENRVLGDPHNGHMGTYTSSNGSQALHSECERQREKTLPTQGVGGQMSRNWCTEGDRQRGGI